MMVNTYYPYTDGLQGVTQYQAEGLVKRGHDVTVITSFHPDAPESETHNGVHIIRMDYRTVHGVYRGDKNAYVKKVLELSEHMDVVIPIGMQAAQTDWILPHIKEIKCKKVLYLHGMAEFRWHKHNFKSLFSIGSKLWNNIRWRTLYYGSIRHMRQFDAVMQLHRFDPAYTFCEKNRISKCYVIENAVNSDFFADGLLPPETLSGKYVICVANYLRGKNQRMCLEAFYRADSREYELVFIGSEETDYLEELKRYDRELSERYGHRQVRFLVRVPRKEIASYVRNASAYLFSSISEKYPVSIAESMAAGVPFVTTEVGCVRYLPGGLIAKDVKEMAYMLELLLKNRKLAESYGRAGKEYAMKYMNENRNVNLFEQDLMEIIG